MEVGLGAPQAELTFTYHVLVGQYIGMACYTLAFYDWLITLDLERSLVWNSDWKFTKVAFLVNRYLPTLDFIFTFVLGQMGFIPISACRATYVAEGIVYLLGLYTAEYVFALRTCAVWGVRRRMYIGLTLFYLGTFVYNAYYYFNSVALLRFFSIPPVTACVAFQPKDPTLFVSYIQLAVYDAVMLGLMLYPTIKNHTGWDKTIPKSNLMKTVYTQGVLFYAYLLVLSCAALAVGIRVTDNVYLFTLVNRMVRSVLACRAILNIRASYEERLNGGCTTADRASSFSDVRFQERRSTSDSMPDGHHTSHDV